MGCRTFVRVKRLRMDVSARVRVLASRVAEREHPEGWFFSEGHADR